jgi:uncharacterized protein YjiS (DUF1127 family)
MAQPRRNNLHNERSHKEQAFTGASHMRELRTQKTAADCLVFVYFHLIISNLSYAFPALLRRNIIAFQAGGYAYFADIRFTGATPVKPRGIAMFASIVRMIRAWRRYNRSLSELSRLGDRELADIGISRSDIPRIAWGASQQG